LIYNIIKNIVYVFLHVIITKALYISTFIYTYTRMSANKSTLQFPNKKQFIVTVPKGLVLAKGWKQGDTIEFSIDNRGDIIIKKK